MTSDARTILLNYLDSKVFQPALDFPEPDENIKGTICKEVKYSVNQTKTRYFMEYSGAEDVYNNFVSDMHSNAGIVLAEKMKWLGMTRFEDIKDDFNRLYQNVT